MVLDAPLFAQSKKQIEGSLAGDFSLLETEKKDTLCTRLVNITIFGNTKVFYEGF